MHSSGTVKEYTTLHDLRLDDYEKRLEGIEATLGDPDHHVTSDRASQISQAVKTVAMKLSLASGRNECGGVYDELYRKGPLVPRKGICCPQS